MKAVLALSVLLASASAAAVHGSVNYDGHKVFRVPVTDDGSHIKSVIDKLKLEVWQPPSKKGAFADIQVSPEQLDDFTKVMDGHELITMHDDLGKSIAHEGTFETYAGRICRGTHALQS